MKKSSKVILIISGVIMALLLILVGIISYFEKLQPEEITYPGSGLSGSIFDTQNTEYTPNASFPLIHEYDDVPYYLDVPQSNKAQVGEGTTYKMNNNIYVYTSEFPFNTDIDYTLSQHLSKVLMLDSDENMTILETQKEEVGYRNGFGVVYDVKNMYVSNGVNSIKAVVMTYYVELPEETKDVLIGVISTVESNDAIRYMKDVLDAEFATFRYDEDREKEISQRMEKEDRAEKQALEEAEKEIAAAKKAEEEAEKEAEKELAKLTTTSDVDIVLDDFYNTLNLKISWSNKDSVQSIILISPDETNYEPVSLESREATFVIPNAQSGKWIARITGVNVGSVNILMEDSGESVVSSIYTEEETTTSSPETTANTNDTTTEITTTTKTVE